MDVLWIVIMSVLLCHVLADITGQEKKDLRCAVCRAVVFEVNTKIRAVNPKKMIDVGNYRIDGEGNQGTRQLAYARSEIHLTELTESICEMMQDYGVTTLHDGRKSVLSTRSNGDGPIHIDNVALSKENTKTLRYMCDDLISENDEDMMDFYTNEEYPLDQMEQFVCSESMTGHCTEEELSTPFPNRDMKIADKLSAKDDRDLKDDFDSQGTGEKEGEEKDEDEGDDQDGPVKEKEAATNEKTEL